MKKISAEIMEKNFRLTGRKEKTKAGIQRNIEYMAPSYYGVSGKLLDRSCAFS